MGPVRGVRGTAHEVGIGDLGVGSGLGIRVLVGWVLAALLVARPGIWGVMDAGVPREACRKGSLGGGDQRAVEMSDTGKMR